MSSDKYIDVIERTYSEMTDFAAKTKQPAPLPHQYIGTAIDNTIVLLIAAANARDGRSRPVSFSEEHNWIALMSTVHRMFLNSIHTHLHAALRLICEERNLTPVISLKQQGMKRLESIRAALEGTEFAKVLEPELTKWEKELEKSYPRFEDHLNAVLNASDLTKQQKKEWRKYFRALNIIRNKASHPDATLSVVERPLCQRGVRR